MGQAGTTEVFHLGEVESIGGGAAGGVHGLVLFFFLVAREGVGCGGLRKGRLLEQPASAELIVVGKGSRSAT